MSLAYRPARGMGVAVISGLGLSLLAHVGIAAYGLSRPLPDAPLIEDYGLKGRDFIDLLPVEMLMAAPEADLAEGDVAQDSQAVIESPKEVVAVKSSDTPLLAQIPYQVDDPELEFRIATEVEEESETAEDAREVPTEAQEQQTTDAAVESRAAAPQASAGQDAMTGSEEQEVGLTDEETLTLVTEWQKDLVLTIAAAKTYPRRAREARAEGTVVVAFTLDTYGRLTMQEVLESSGWPVLDNAALDLFDGFERLPPPPAAMGAGPFDLRLPISYAFR
ncbi:energy transducer TonB [Roseovarius sp.]|uniref:energy transducer TonB n=1 Tax=Roseovarius sp. TaxID=1486281 RepID=UPI0026292CBC|nr:energy transducer TonB [Roseovarius sp.]